MNAPVPEALSRGSLLAALYNEPSSRFEDLATAAGLNPLKDFQSRDLRALDFSAANLLGYNFSGSDLRGTSLRLAENVDKTTIISGALLDSADADWYNARISDTPPVDMELAEDLRNAIDRGQFVLFFEPIISLADGAVTEADAFFRWHHPERGDVAIAQIIHLFEDRNIIKSIGLWMIETAIEQQRVLIRRGFDIKIAISISHDLIGRAEFIADCKRLVTGQATDLRFKISEYTFLEDPEASVRNIQTLIDMGISIAIEDYGVGFLSIPSGLKLFKQFSAQSLRIDGSLIRKLDEVVGDELVVEAAIDFGHALGWKVTAEGVETASQLKTLAAMKCDAARGYFIAKPMDIEELANRLDAGIELSFGI